MVGDKYWTTGITVSHFFGNRWQALVEFFDDGFCQDESTQGTLRTRYYGDLAHAIDTVIADADRLGIQWKDRRLYSIGDGEDYESPMPEGWKLLLKAQAERVGFEFPYQD